MGIIFTKIFIVFVEVGFLSLDKTPFFDKTPPKILTIFNFFCFEFCARNTELLLMKMRIFNEDETSGMTGQHPGKNFVFYI
jgi:hypothetical protein